MVSVSSTRRRAAGAALAGLLALMPVQAAQACAFHTDLPELSVADWLVDGPEVVLARPDPDNPYAFRLTEVIHSAGTPPEIDLLVSSELRRKLAMRPADEVLLANDGYGWRIVKYVDARFRPILRAVLAQAPGWGDGYPAERLEIFAALQDSPDADLRQLALMEIDKAPYGLLREMELRLSPEELLRELWLPQAYGYQPIRVLLLGLSDSARARDEVRSFLERVSEWEFANNLGAYATAEIELNGAAGVGFLQERYLSDPRQSLTNLEQVVEAMAIQHGVASAGLRTEIAAALSAFVAARPAGAALVARQFLTREDWSQGPLLARVMEEKRLTAAPDLLPVAIYVAQARGAGLGQGPEPRQGIAQGPGPDG